VQHELRHRIAHKADYRREKLAIQDLRATDAQSEDKEDA
jgi:hypothetical protein